MKYFSEKLNELFDTQEALQEAEASSTKKKKKSSVKDSEPAVEPSVPTRKELASQVELADENLRKAYADYETAKVKAEELSKRYLEEVDAILDPARVAVQDAERARYDAIRKFNDSFGAYQVTYTGARAADELMKAMNNINTRTSKMFRELFNI